MKITRRGLLVGVVSAIGAAGTGGYYLRLPSFNRIQLNKGLDGKIRNDFEKGNIAQIDDWFLSDTEIKMLTKD